MIVQDLEPTAPAARALDKLEIDVSGFPRVTMVSGLGSCNGRIRTHYARRADIAMVD